jgi:cellulose synthase/poly-beta-1,6-N-acetylglucosamine synthase-like glycosyltransferase
MLKFSLNPMVERQKQLTSGIVKASGDILFCIDADTIISHDAIEKMLTHFENNKSRCCGW